MCLAESDPLQPKQLDFLEQLAISGQICRKLHYPLNIFLEQPFGQSTVRSSLSGPRQSYKSHSIKQTLEARRRKHFFYVCSILGPGAAISAQTDGLLQPLRNSRRVSIIYPECRIGSPA